jgi:micrococcal nuclease
MSEGPDSVRRVIDDRATRVSREALFVVVMAAFLLIPAVACGLSMGVDTAPSPPAPSIPGLRANGSATALVTSTVDGDTVHVRVQGHDDKVRFIGVDTPEVDWYGHRGECYGASAGRYTRQRLEGKTVRLDFDVRLRDVYGRLLAYVYVGDELFNRTLVERGLATDDAVPPDTRMASTFAAAENAAHAAGRGLWSACPDR